MKRKSEFDYRREAKVLVFDIEVAPATARFYGNIYYPKIVEVIDQPKLVSVAWKWLGDNKIQCKTIADYTKDGDTDDTLLVKKLHSLLDEATAAMAYNGKRYDIKMANTFFIEKGLPPTSFTKPIDPLQTAKGQFSFPCNKLDYVAKLLEGIGKTETTCHDCWKDLLEGKGVERKKAHKLMKEYNIRDIEILEKVYYKMLPWMYNHPNMALMSGHDVCPRCGHNEGFTISKYRYTGTQVNAVQLQCCNCGSYVTRRLEKEEREELEAQGKLKSTFRNLTP